MERSVWSYPFIQVIYKIADALPKEMDGLAKKLHLDKQRLSDMPMLMMKIYVTRL